MTDLIIAPATLADAPDIAEIYAHHVLHGVATFEIEPPDAAEIARRMAAGLDLGLPWLVARDEAGVLAGYAYAGYFHPRSAYRFTCEDSIYVRHDRLGRAIGTALLDALIAAARARGFRQMIALITGGSDGSILLHRHFGFIEAGRLAAVGYKHGRWLDVVTMQLALDGTGSNALP